MRDYPEQHKGNVIQFERPLSTMSFRHDSSRSQTAPALRPSCPESFPPISSEAETETFALEASLRERLDQAMADWSENFSGPIRDGQNAPIPMHVIPTLLSDIRTDPYLDRPVRDARAYRALEGGGDTSLRRLALMTPQEILALNGCGPGVLKRVIRELSSARTLTVPEIVTGTGKSSLDKAMTAPLDDLFEGILSDHYRLSPPRMRFQPRIV